MKSVFSDFEMLFSDFEISFSDFEMPENQPGLQNTFLPYRFIDRKFLNHSQAGRDNKVTISKNVTKMKTVKYLAGFAMFAVLCLHSCRQEEEPEQPESNLTKQELMKRETGGKTDSTYIAKDLPEPKDPNDPPTK